MWRTIATVMDDFRPSEFPVNFASDKELLSSTFRREDNERMVGIWINDALEDDKSVSPSAPVVFDKKPAI
jgi:hypothetical protein